MKNAADESKGKLANNFISIIWKVTLLNVFTFYDILHPWTYDSVSQNKIYFF